MKKALGLVVILGGLGFALANAHAFDRKSAETLKIEQMKKDIILGSDYAYPCLSNRVASPCDARN